MSDYGRDRGQALPWMMMVVAAAMTLVVVAVRLAIVVDDAARARTAADAAALAGAARANRRRETSPSATVPSFSRSSARGAVCESRCGSATSRLRPRRRHRPCGCGVRGDAAKLQRWSCPSPRSCRRPSFTPSRSGGGSRASAHGRCLAAVRSRRSSRRPRREGTPSRCRRRRWSLHQVGSGV